MAGSSSFEKYLAELLGGDEPRAEWSDDRRDDLPELFIGFARPQGTDNATVMDAVEEQLRSHEYLRHDIKISELLDEAAILWSRAGGPERPKYERRQGFRRITDLMQWGDFFRRSTDSFAMARFAIMSIQMNRARVQEDAIAANRKGIAYFVSNLVHPNEVELLRSIYKQRFFLLATHQPEDLRLNVLEADFRRLGSHRAREEAEQVIRIDAGDRPAEFPDALTFDVASQSGALNINDTFHHADVFVGQRPDDHERIIKRWIDQVFNYPWGTPTLDEFGMSLAFGAARVSASLGRSVGAALLTAGSVVALGWNDPAQPTGGVSRDGSVPALREHELDVPVDPSDQNRLDSVREILDRLFGEQWEAFYSEDNWPAPDKRTAAQASLRDWLDKMREAARNQPITEEMVMAMPMLRPLGAARIFNLIEFGRSVHAEMAAITDAAKRGVATQGATLYVTTFPCHECARNIVAAGIERVVFVEPYGKSMTSRLYRESVVNRAEDSTARGVRIPFEPFLGISPARFEDLFASTQRKTGLREAAVAIDRVAPGHRVEWDAHSSRLRTSLEGDVSSVARYFQSATRLAEHEVVGGLADYLREVFPNLKDIL